ncbi:SdpI family protein [Facklamia sp. 7083-14-GEN3]|uniref:SdpI family protein n=1 Tax=Facklamia sp. 7083-14-GEN3 TaxID=2973478 RepID=UPI00215CC9CB|nr:SdpI family protein [Facklamia sp. 7083-14-GEN3]MCR8969408.1 SdpI family protein [Facklamia sp. 7083-14-GEN3]
MTKNVSKYLYINWIITLVSLLLATYFFFKAPETIATHFDFAGKADSYGSKANFFMFPGMMVGFNLLAELLRRIDPRRENFKRFERPFYLIIFVTNVFLFFMQLAMGAFALKWIDQLPSYLEGSVGILFIILGNYMPKIKQNYFMGIRTPWALADEKVWYLTHRFGGKVFVVMGILIMLNTLLSSEIRQWTFLVIALGGVLIIYAASYWFFQKHKNSLMESWNLILLKIDKAT